MPCRAGTPAVDSRAVMLGVATVMVVRLKFGCPELEPVGVRNA
jgi:hypothetical protein